MAFKQFFSVLFVFRVKIYIFPDSNQIEISFKSNIAL